MCAASRSRFENLRPLLPRRAAPRRAAPRACVAPRRSSQVTSGGTERSVLRRYSDFSRLHASMAASGLGGSSVPFPPKTTCSNFFAPSERTLSQRQSVLGSYLKALLRQPEALDHTDVREFLQLDSFPGGAAERPRVLAGSR